MNRFTMMAAVGAAAAAIAMPHWAGAQTLDQAKFEFALIGDTPYGVEPGADYPPLDNLVAEINSDAQIQWVLHVGDIKAVNPPCSDALFADRLSRYNAFKVPFVLTPGDNDWTDCHRVKAGSRQPLERLAKFREVFYPKPDRTLGQQPMTVTSQASDAGYEEFPENVMWSRDNIVFATFHAIGSKNGLAPFADDSQAVRTEANDREVERRTAAAIVWLNKAFDQAEALNSPGVFLVTHANMGLEIDPTSRDRTGFTEILTALEDRIKAFGRPVVLAHGDSHFFRVDKPTLASGKFLPNFTRVETFGSSRVHWLRVSVDPQTPEVFTIRQQIVKGNVG